MSIWKRAGIYILAIIMLCCVVVDAFWVYIKFFAPEKTVISTYNLDTIETVANEDGETTEDYILKVKYYSNDNNNGYEAIEVMINSFYDESMTSIRSYGVQVVFDNADSSIYTSQFYNDSKTADKDYWYYNFIWYECYSYWGDYALNGTYSYYESDDLFENFTVSSSSDIADDGFIVTLANTEDIYQLNFAGNIYENEGSHIDSDNFVSYEWYVKNMFCMARRDYYYSYNLTYLISALFDMLQSTANGTYSSHILDLADIFTFSVYDGSTYIPVSNSTIDKINEDNQTFFGVLIEKTADGLSTASQSMFGAVNNSAQYDNGLGDTDDDGESDVTSEYTYGKDIIVVDIYDFDYAYVGDYYLLSLSDEFISAYYSSRSSIMLSVQIDLDTLTADGINFYGFVDGCFNGWSVYECYTYTGSTITGVNYA